MTTQQVVERGDYINMNLLSFGFDKHQTQFLEHRVFNQHPQAIQSLYDRVRYNIKTFGLNDNVDINIHISVTRDGTLENYNLNTGNTRIAQITTVLPPSLVNDGEFETLQTVQLAQRIDQEVLPKTADKSQPNEYVQLDDSGVVDTGIDVAFVKKFFTDFVIDMGQFNVDWTFQSTEEEFTIQMLNGDAIVLFIKIFHPNYAR